MLGHDLYHVQRAVLATVPDVEVMVRRYLKGNIRTPRAGQRRGGPDRVLPDCF